MSRGLVPPVLLRATLAGAVLWFSTGAFAQSFPPVGPELQVSVSGGSEPAVAAHSDGGYVVVWRSGTSVVG